MASRNAGSLRRPALFLLPLLIALMALCALSCSRYEGLSPQNKRDRAIQIWYDAYEKYEKNGDYERAIAAYQNALEISPRPAVLYHLGHCYAQTGDYDRARNYLQQALEMKPGYELAQVELQRVDNMDPSGARKPSPTMPAMPTLPRISPALTQPDAAGAVTGTDDVRPAPTAPTARVAFKPTKDMILLVDDGSEAPARTVGGAVPEALPAPHKATAASPPEPAQIAEASPSPSPSREDDIRPRPTLEKVPEPGATPAAAVRVLPTATPAPDKNLPEIIVTRPRASYTPTPVQLAQPLPTLPPTQPPTPRPAPTAIPTVAMPPTATPTRIVVPTATPTLAPTPVAPNAEEVHKTLFEEKGGQGTQRPSPAARPTPYQSPETASGASIQSFGYHYAQGSRFLEHKEYARAVGELERALQYDPRNLEGLLKLGDAYKSAGRTQQALKQYNLAAQYHEHQPRVYLKIGNLYIDDRANQEHQAQAYRAYQRAVSIDPNYKEAYNNLGILDMTAGRVDEAMQNFQKVIDIDNDYANAHLNLGILYEEYKRNTMKAYYHYSEYVRLGGRRADEVQGWIKELENRR